MRITLVLICSLFFTSLLHSQTYKKFGIANSDNDLPKGLSVGEIAPDFELKSKEGQSFILSEERKDGPVVVVFYRGQWCGHCIRYLSNLQDSLSYIQSAGASLLAITPEIKEMAEKTEQRSNASFPILLDNNDEVMKVYDVAFEVNLAYQNKLKVGKLTSLENVNDQEEAKLPVPATYVIDSDGQIIFVQFNYDYSIRPSVKSILEAILKT